MKHPFLRSALSLILVAGALLCGQLFAADYTDGNLRKNDFKFLQMTLFGNLKTETDNNNAFLEIEGGSRSGVLDFYFFFDVNGSFNERRNGDFFTKIKPRLSLDGMFKKDYSSKFVKELFLSFYYKGGNNWDQQRYGFGADLNVPGAEYFSVNFYRNFEKKVGNPNGYVFTTTWGFPLKTYRGGNKLSYTSWADWDFDQGDGDNFGMKNSLRYDFDDYAIVLGYFFNSQRDHSSDIGFMMKF